MSNEEAEKEIKKITEVIVDKYKPEKIILFGSFAYGNPTKASDIDMLIVKDSKKRRIDRIKEILMLVDNNLPFEPLVYTPSEIEERLSLKDFFVSNILNKGRVLYQQ